MIAAAASGVVVAPSRADAKRSDVVVAFAGASLPLAMARSLGILAYQLVTSVAYQFVTEPDGQPSVPLGIRPASHFPVPGPSARSPGGRPDAGSPRPPQERRAVRMPRGHVRARGRTGSPPRTGRRRPSCRPRARPGRP